MVNPREEGDEERNLANNYSYNANAFNYDKKTVTISTLEGANLKLPTR